MSIFSIRSKEETLGFIAEKQFGGNHWANNHLNFCRKIGIRDLMFLGFIHYAFHSTYNCCIACKPQIQMGTISKTMKTQWGEFLGWFLRVSKAKFILKNLLFGIGMFIVIYTGMSTFVYFAIKNILTDILYQDTRTQIWLASIWL